ncbi:tyrosine-type recombinase/integrase [Escherichia coli]|nr:tyrosine-type recombinase/integrase [Escherichia coli]
MRRSEAAQMRWDQINGERWTIPATKNGKSHIVTLHPYMLSLIKHNVNSLKVHMFLVLLANLAFPITNDALTRALERVRSKYLAELTPFSPHDLRRSVATGCAEYLDAPERLIELLLNHVPKDRLIRTYQVGQQAEKLKNLFIEWGNFIMNNVITVQQNAPDNVIHIKFEERNDKNTCMV